MPRFTAIIDAETMSKLDALVKRFDAPSRSEMIRKLIRHAYRRVEPDRTNSPKEQIDPNFQGVR